METKEGYEGAANELVRRIAALIPDNPQILDSVNFRAGDLFGVDGFYCDDLNPSAFQAGWALSKARREYSPGGAS